MSTDAEAARALEATEGSPEATDERERYDDLPRYCRKLGHAVTFRYCRGVTAGLPCALALDCWYDTFDVASHLRACYSPEDLERIFTPPKDKLGQIADILAALGHA